MARENLVTTHGPRPHSVCYMLLLLLSLSLLGCHADWQTGRATRYGGLDDPWSIHDGSCYHSYLGWEVKTGWDVAAMADTFPGFQPSSYCGRCFEIRCRDAQFSDGYGQVLDRSSVCYDESASLVVQITDECPCNYASNAYSNKRWCCGDMPHLDLSQWAFEKLAPSKWGVIGISYREVSCGTQPSQPAQLPAGQQPSPGYAPPPGWDSARDDPRPWPAS